MNSNHNTRVLAALVASALLAAPVWAAEGTDAAAVAAPSVVSTVSAVPDASTTATSSEAIPAVPAVTTTAAATDAVPAVSTATVTGTAVPAGTVAEGTAASTAPVFNKYTVATDITNRELVSMPYGTAVTNEAVAPYTGKTTTGVHISPVPEPGIETSLLSRLAMRTGDAVNIDYIRHDADVIGSTGLFSTVTPTFVTVPEGVDLTYIVKLNPVVNKVEFTGNHLYSAADLSAVMNPQPGSVMNSVLTARQVAAINAMYSDKGYIMSRVKNVNLDDAGVLHVDITEGRIEDILLKGNKKTRNYVIMRELKVKKGDVFNKDLARRSIERIYNTGYFEDVNVRLMPGKKDPSNVIIEIEVLEQKTGSVTIGAGYSDSDGLVGILGLSETNLRGTGDKASINWEFGGNTNSKRNYIFSYTRPWINDHGDSLGLSIFDRESEYNDYNEDGDSIADYYKKTTGGNITLGRVRSEYVKDYFTLETKRTEYTKHESGYNYNEDGTSSSNNGYDFKGMDYLGHNFGRTNSLTWAHVFDNRDNIYDPTRGKRLSFTGVMAGHGLGGDFDYYKFIVESRTYYKVGHAQVIAVRLMGGFGNGDMPYSDLFTLGGSDNLRGYEDDQFKGNRMYEATVEYRYPIIKKVQGVIFADAGDAWGGTDYVPWYNQTKQVHFALGLGFRVTTPIGPIRLDYARGSSGGKFHFSFGGKF